jgi:hypothetical protein
MSNELVIGCLERIRERITENIRTSGEWASGETAKSMRIEETERGGRLIGRPDFWSLEEGSEPSPLHKYPANFQQIIYDWMEDKGIAPSDQYEHVTVAGSIAWYIRKHGTRLYREGGRQDIYSNVIDEEVANLKKTIAAEIISTLAYTIKTK